MLQIIVIPRNYALLQGFGYPHFSVECGDDVAIDDDVVNDVAVALGLDSFE